jgi:polar amino acid transport system substrate-binding protein
VRSIGADGEVETQFCEPIGHKQVQGDYVESWQPQPMSPLALERARDIAQQGHRPTWAASGVFGVELFVKDDMVWFSEVSPRPHDTGMVTMATQVQSEFELHAKAILGLPVNVALRSPGASAVIYGQLRRPASPSKAWRKRCACRARTSACSASRNRSRAAAWAWRWPPLRSCPLKRCLLMLEQGSADIIIGLRETPEREAYLRFLHTPYREHGADRVFYVPAGRQTVIRDYADLARLRIGVKLGAEYFERFDQDKSLQKEAVKDMEANFRKLALGRIDAVLIPEDQGEALIADLHLEGRLEKAPYRVPDRDARRSIAVSRKSVTPQRLEVLERVMSTSA